MSLKVLYVEDEPDMRMLAKMAMETVGSYDVRDCESGPEALKAADDGFVPDVILLDSLMVPMDGLTTLAELRKRPALAAIPAIFLTGRSEPKEIQIFKDAGATGVIAKPFDPFSLVDQIGEILGGEKAA